MPKKDPALIRGMARQHLSIGESVLSAFGNGYKTTGMLLHLLKILPPLGDRAIDLPNHVHPAIHPVVDVFGTKGYEQVEREIATITGAGTQATASTTPDGRVRYVVAADVFHTKAAASVTHLFYLHVTSGFAISLAQATLATSIHLPMPRPIYLGPGWTLRAEVVGALAGAETLNVVMAFMQSATGGYVLGP